MNAENFESKGRMGQRIGACFGVVIGADAQLGQGSIFATEKQSTWQSSQFAEQERREGI